MRGRARGGGRAVGEETEESGSCPLDSVVFFASPGARRRLLDSVLVFALRPGWLRLPYISAHSCLWVVPVSSQESVFSRYRYSGLLACLLFDRPCASGCTMRELKARERCACCREVPARNHSLNQRAPSRVTAHQCCPSSHSMPTRSSSNLCLKLNACSWRLCIFRIAPENWSSTATIRSLSRPCSFTSSASAYPLLVFIFSRTICLPQLASWVPADLLHWARPSLTVHVLC